MFLTKRTFERYIEAAYRLGYVAAHAEAQAAEQQQAAQRQQETGQMLDPVFVAGQRESWPHQ